MGMLKFIFIFFFLLLPLRWVCESVVGVGAYNGTDGCPFPFALVVVKRKPS